jgi:diguanylate cyclase (GGDEF)-like protein
VKNHYDSAARRDHTTVGSPGLTHIDHELPVLLESVIKHVPEATIVSDGRGIVHWANAQAKSEIYVEFGTSIFDYIDVGSRNKLARMVRESLSGIDVASEIVFAVNDQPKLYDVHIFEHQGHLVFLARESSSTCEQFQGMSALLSQFAALYRESIQQQSELEEQGNRLRSVSQALDTERRRLLSLIDQLPEGIIFISDVSGEISMSNTRVRELWQTSAPPDHLEQLKFSSTPDEQPVDWSELPVIRAMQSGQDEGPDEYVIRPNVVDDNVRSVQLLASPVLDDQGLAIGATMSIVDVTEQKVLRDRLADQAFRDPLTGLGNRRKLVATLASDLEQGCEYAGTVALLYIDLDGFKPINDNLGHEAGDLALREVAARLLRTVRLEDTVVRMGGDEFAVYLPDIGARSDIDQVVMRILESLSEPAIIGGQRVRLSGSIGVALSRRVAPLAPNELVRRADLAMYQAKASGAGRWAHYADLSRPLSIRHPSMTDELMNALETEQFELLYRPAIDPSTGKVREIEIAMFWRHVTDGLLDDTEIRSRAWRAGVLHAVSEQAAELGERDRPILMEALGTSRRITMTRQFWAEYLREDRVAEQIVQIGEAIQNTPIDVHIELSGLLSPADDDLNRNIERIQDSGIFLSVAHAGDNNGDLSLLWNRNVDGLVVSPELIAAAPNDEDADRFIASLVHLARSFGIKVKAPGIDSSEKLQIALRHGVDLVSGDLISEPLTALQLRDFHLDSVFIFNASCPNAN